MSTLTVLGTMTFPALLGGPNASPVIGAPVVTPTTATTGHTVTYGEGGLRSLSIGAGVTQAISFDSVAAGNFVYVGSDQACDIAINGSADLISITAGGFIMISKAGITALSVTAGVVACGVSIILLGD